MSVVKQKARAKVSWAERSDADGLVIADDGSPGSSYREDAKRQPHPETSIRSSLGSRFDICEVFSPARTSAMAEKCGLRGGWSLDLFSAVQRDR